MPPDFIISRLFLSNLFFHSLADYTLPTATAACEANRVRDIFKFICTRKFNYANKFHVFVFACARARVLKILCNVYGSATATTVHAPTKATPMAAWLWLLTDDFEYSLHMHRFERKQNKNGEKKTRKKKQSMFKMSCNENAY